MAREIQGKDQLDSPGPGMGDFSTKKTAFYCEAHGAGQHRDYGSLILTNTPQTGDVSLSKLNYNYSN